MVWPCRFAIVRERKALRFDLSRFAVFFDSSWLFDFRFSLHFSFFRCNGLLFKTFRVSWFFRAKSVRFTTVRLFAFRLSACSLAFSAYPPPTAVCKHSTTCRCTDKCSGCGMGLEKCRSLTILCYHSGDNTCDWCYLGCAWTCQDMPTALLAAVLEEVLHLLSSSLSTHRTHSQPCQYSHAVESCLGSIVEVALVSLAVASARRFGSPRRFRQNKPQYQHFAKITAATFQFYHAEDPFVFATHHPTTLHVVVQAGCTPNSSASEARLDLPFIHLVAVASEEDLARYRKALHSVRGFTCSHVPLAARAALALA